jgi:hypothetical protein
VIISMCLKLYIKKVKFFYEINDSCNWIYEGVYICLIFTFNKYSAFFHSISQNQQFTLGV